ncbi:acetyl-CoA C-acyltransferase [Kordiimonas pumila]|uniref:Acetyl-CoA C-acyltransferase n=1 Tax=Kordiimonas pumila TaxID=2161677 RepID=A0ABV7D6U8_9PROT|nr:acetyl-CoA C-acyltransferase [Kordiimonas pumila]
MSPVFICDAVRTPRGKARAGGGLHAVKPVDLMALVLKALEERNRFDTKAVHDIILGCVTQVGDQGGNIARTACLVGGWSSMVPGMTINRYCTSGLDAAVLASSKIMAGVDSLSVAGGIEVMSRVPMLSDNGAYYADPDVASRAPFIPLGIAADLVATLENISRSDVDGYAATSQQRAARARRDGYFNKSMVPVTDPLSGDTIEADENIREDTTVDSLAAFEPIFADLGKEGYDDLALKRYRALNAINHVHHIGNSPAMADGASAILLANQNAVLAHTLKPRAKVLSMANVSVDPVLMLTGGIDAAGLALKRADMVASDIDLVEFNEAFAAVVIKFMRDMRFDMDRVNVNGGAIALGHAMGSTGTSLIGMALDELERRDLTTGLISVSGGAGVGTAMVIERV